MQQNPKIAALSEYGITWPGAMDFMPRLLIKDAAGNEVPYGEMDRAKVRMAFDALDGTQPTLETQPNAGVLAYLTTYFDPRLIEILFSPTKAAEIYGEQKEGDWTTETAAFALIENVGEVAAYGDHSTNGMSSANANWPQRQSFKYQTITQWGELETARMGLARIDWAARKNISAANSLNRYRNLSYFFGVAGLANYGGLNDPSLSAALTPATAAAGGTSWQNKLPTEILADFQAAFFALQQQSGGNLETTDRLTLALSPDSMVWLTNANAFGMVAMAMLKTAFPNLTVKTAVQYLSGTTYSFQLIVDEWPDGQRTCTAAFNEMMRAHPVITQLSSFMQKKSAGTWGTIIYRPIGIVSMVGI